MYNFLRFHKEITSQGTLGICLQTFQLLAEIKYVLRVGFPCHWWLWPNQRSLLC